MAVGDGARWGKESLFKISSSIGWGDLILNDLSNPNRHRITGIDGLYSDADIRDQREANPSDHGELRIGNKALYGGKTIVIRGFTEAGDMLTLRGMQRQMKRVVNELMGDERPLYIYSDPRWREQNLITDPSFEIATAVWSVTNPAGVTGITTGRTGRAVAGGSGSQSYRMAHTKDANTTQRLQAVYTPTGMSGMLVVPGQFYALSALVDHVNAPAQGTRAQIFWYKADGAPSVVNPQADGSYVGVNTNGVFKASVVGVAPSDAVFAAVQIQTATATSGDVVDVYVDSVLLQPSSEVNNYFDGETSGYSWEGARYSSKSTSMRSAQIGVSKNQPLIMDEDQNNWKLEREFMLTLRATNPRILGQYLESLTLSNTGVTVTTGTARNEGDYPAQLTVRFNGVMASNPKLENLTSAKTLQTLQSALGSGEYTDFIWDGVKKRIIDQTGVARPSRFDPTLASWLEAKASDNSMRLTTSSNGGAGASAVLSWRDTWM